jgi:hypothetical protein
MIGKKKTLMQDRGPHEQEWRRWHPHDDDPPELAEWGEDHREHIFEQMMKIFRNTPKEQSLPGMGSAENFSPSIAVWICMIIALIIMIAVQAFVRSG